MIVLEKHKILLLEGIDDSAVYIFNKYGFDDVVFLFKILDRNYKSILKYK